MGMRRCIALLLIILGFCLPSKAQTISYWWQGELRQGNAKLAQQYFFLPGANVNFTYDAAFQHVYINANGTNGGGGTNSGPPGPQGLPGATGATGSTGPTGPT